MGKNPVLKGTTWTAIQEMFVADAGTMTITHTLTFTSDKDVLVKEASYMPAYPAMYVNPDGSIDMHPARSSEREYACTYSFSKGILTVTSKEGEKQDYTYKEDGTFSREEPWGEILVFSQSKE